MSNALSQNLKNAVTGHYKLDFKAMFQEAWQKVFGVKKAFWLAVLWVFLLALILSIVFSLTETIATTYDFIVFANIVRVISNVVFSIFSSLFTATFVYMMINHISGRAVHDKMVFDFRGMINPLLITAAVLLVANMIIGIVLGLMIGLTSVFSMAEEINFSLVSLLGLISMLAFLVLFYVNFIFHMATYLIIEKKIAFKLAIKTAFKAIFKKFFKNLGFLLLMTLFLVIGVIITLGIGIIWLFPMVTNINAIWYRQIFGIEPVETTA